MQLYAGTSKQFIDDAVQRKIADKLTVAYRNYFQRNPSPSEERSWQNSLTQMCMVLYQASLDRQGVALEYQIPSNSSRLDVLITGTDSKGQPNAVIVELKQWTKVNPSWISDSVVVFVGGRNRDVLHPSRQVGNYYLYLQNTSEVFHKDGVNLSACSYVHNVNDGERSELFDERFKTLLTEYPLFTGDQTPKLAQYLTARVEQGDDAGILDQVLESKHRPSKQLLEHVGDVLKQEDSFVLLDEQQVAFNAVLDTVSQAHRHKHKVVVLIQGGPGTGKSLIALNLVGNLSSRGYNTQYATGSKSFTENVRKIVGSRAAIQFGYFANYQAAEPNSVDVLILDEAHRMFATGNGRFTPSAKRSDRPLIEHIIEASKVSVFFIDDRQAVRPNEVGRVSLIREASEKLGAVRHEFELDAQFRCMGSDAFINWVDNTLGTRTNVQTHWDTSDEYDFKIFDQIADLDQALRARQSEGFKARLTAGFCWKWSEPNPDGTLVNDVMIEEWSMPWNAKPDSTHLAAGIPKSIYWPTDPNGINQIGCIYTSQNFEFDYVGVIFGPDLRFDPASGTWIGDITQSHDSVVKRAKDQFVELVKNTYRVLLTRGIRGCYVYFVDLATKEHFKSLMVENQ
jgi:DUF2075 family protein